jgi:Fe2+ transport system protein FeoA
MSIAPERRAVLRAHGVRPGVILHVDGDAPFRGPRIVRLGRARLAIARAVAAGVIVMLEAEVASSLVP